MDDHGWRDAPLAVIGMACRVPGANRLDEYWELIARAGCALGPLPPERFDETLYFDPQKGVTGKSYSRLGGIVELPPFDRSRYPLSADLIARCDPVHLAFLEVSGEALHHAGLEPYDLPLRNVGVYVGNARGGLRSSNIVSAVHAHELADFLVQTAGCSRLGPAARAEIVPSFVGRLLDVYRDPDQDRVILEANRVAGLVAEVFGLTGPAMAVDAACASSLVGLAIAARALRRGRIEMAIVGGASYSAWTSLVLFSQAQALSATGSFPFDARADGFVSSDGYAAIVVKTLERALADGDRVWGVIRGLGVSSDGRGKSLWAPRREGQVLAIRRALAAGVDAAHIGYVEAHGTSTQLGDATEIAALTEALGPSLSRSQRIPVASVKANIGHTRETAGLAGLIKTILAMHHGQIPPAAGFEQPNPEIPWETIPFMVPTSLSDWTPGAPGGPRRGAVDAFGIGGLNVHVLVDDAPEQRPGSVHALVPDNVGRSEKPAQPPGADDVAVIGRGAIFPGARTFAVFLDLVQGDRDALSAVPADRWNCDLFPELSAACGNGVCPPRGGFVTGFEYDWRKHRIPPRQIAHADPLQFMVLDAAEQALEDAGCLYGGLDLDSTAVVIGAGFGGDFSIGLALALRVPEFQQVVRDCLTARGVPVDEIEPVCAEFAGLLRARYSALEDETASYSASTLASRVAKTLDLKGGAFAVDAGGGSSLAALSAAVDLLESGACSAVLCAGAQRALDPSVFQSYRVRRLNSDSSSSSEAGTANGFVPGEGCGVVLLKRRVDAERDGNVIYGVIRGIGVATSPCNRRAACATAATRALSAAGERPDTLRILEPTGVAMQDVDADEHAGLVKAYGEPGASTIERLDAITRRIGYSNGASGMASLLKLLAVLPDRRSSPVPEVCIAAGIVQAANGAARDKLGGGEVQSDVGQTCIFGAVNSLSPSGQAYHLVVEYRAPTRRELPSAKSGSGLRLVRFEASSSEELLASLREWRAMGHPALPSLDAFSTRGAARLAIVGRDDASIGQQIDQALGGVAQPAVRAVLERRGIFWGMASTARPRIAFAFAGQGSQYAGMLRGLIDQSPVAAEELGHLNGMLLNLGLPTFEQLAWTNQDQLGRELFQTQLAVLLADLLLFRVLRASGVVPDVVTAHSYGEYAALVASGAWELNQAIEITRVRCEAIAACGIQGGMLATTAPAARVELLLRDCGSAGDVFLANHNAPDQTILAGRDPALTEFARRLQADGHETRRLPVPGPFHTPLMAPVQPVLRTAVSGCVLRPPTVPFLSSVTNRFTADPLDLRDNLVEQLVRPVRYVDLVRRIREEGIDVIVEVGPRDVLTKLHRQILGDAPVRMIATDDTNQPGVEQLLRVQAVLECHGVQLGATSRAPAPAAENAAARRMQPVLKSGPIVHFDATSSRRERNRRAPGARDRDDRHRPTAARTDPAATDPGNDELAGFLIRFVCEHTGYPPEVVDLDAELEADLGIDSIKKAQLLGELREHFPLQPSGRLTLDAFPTLRHILEFLRESQAVVPAGGAAGGHSASDEAIVAALFAEDRVSPRLDVSPDASVIVPAAIADDVKDQPRSVLNVLTFCGTPYDMGVRHGQLEEHAIRRTLQKYAELLGDRLFEMRPLQSALEHRNIYFGDDGLAELQGIADAVNMPVEHLAAFNYGLSMEFLPGCTQFAVAARRNGSTGLIHAVNEDWMLALALPGTLKRMTQVRFPAGGIPFLTLSTCGELAGQNGINARGVAVTSTLLLDRLRRDETTPGRVHPALVREILEGADSIDAALDIVRNLPRCGAWSMCLSHWESDRLCYVEYDAASVHVRWSEEFVESTNHCLLQPALGETPAQSCQRLERLHELLHGEPVGDARLTVQRAQAILRDRYDRSLGRFTTHPTRGTIRRPYTQASLVMRPATGDVWVTADSVAGEEPDRFHHLRLPELFRSDADGLRRPTEATPAPVANDDPVQSRAVPNRIMNRFVLRMVDAPLRDDMRGSEPISGRVLLLGENPTADAVRFQLAESGTDVLTLPASSADAALRELERIWTDGPAPMLLLVTARDVDAACGVALEPWQQRRQHGVLLPYLVCQRWVQLVTRGEQPLQARLIAATGMEGDFGLSGRSASVEGGALTGLLKAIRHEFDQVSVKIIDVPLDDPPALVARCLLQEVASGAPDVEVAYVCGRRRVLQPVPRRVVARERGFRPRGTWIVTGGGRGVTAFVAREFAKRYELNLHVLGSSPPPPSSDADLAGSADIQELRREVLRQARDLGVDPAARWRDVERRLELAANLREYASAGVAATYHCCDVTDRRQLARTLDEIRSAAGPIRGILHGAGVEAACRFDRKSLPAVEQTIATKVDAVFSLAELTRSDPVEFFIGFGSISGRFGGHGQTDYSLASDLLAKVLGRLRRERPDCRAAAIHWPAWGETGMAMRPESKLALELAGHRFMPPPEGAAHLFNELEAGAPEGEVLLYDWPASRGTRRSPWTPAEVQAYWRSAETASAAPLIDGIVQLNERRIVAELAFDPLHDPFLVHHRIEGVPILPLVVALEAFAEASHLLRPDGIRAFRDIRIHEGLRFPQGASDRARVEVRIAEGISACELRSDYRNRRGSVTDPSRLHVSAVIDNAAAWTGPAVVPVPAIAKWTAMVYDTTDESAIKRVVSHGPPLQCLRELCIAGDRLWGRIRAASPTELSRSPATSDWLLPSAALDACLLACSVLAYVQKKPFHLPCGVNRLRFHSPPTVGEECLVAVCRRDEDSERATYDFSLSGADGRIILEACGYHAAILKAMQPAS